MSPSACFAVPPSCSLNPQYNRRVRVFDTTLRDGVDGLGIVLAPTQRARLARAVANLVPDILEAGYTRQPDGLRSIEAVANSLRTYQDAGTVLPMVAALVPVNVPAVKSAASAGAELVNIFATPGSCNCEQLQNVIADALVVDGVKEVQFTVQRSTAKEVSRGDLREVIEAASEAGASTVSLADSGGRSYPAHVRDLTDVALECHRGKRVSFHAHNDTGLALANSLAAVEAGATQVEVTLGGMGTRSGNCAFEEFAAALPLCCPNRFMGSRAHDKDAVLFSFRELQSATGFNVGDTKPIIGRGSWTGYTQLDT